MKTNEFKRVVNKTLSAKTEKEAFRSILRKQRGVNLLYSALGLSVAVGKLEHSLQGYVLGHQLTPDMKAGSRHAFGGVAHHGVAVAKLVKAKVPSSQRKIKPRNTPTFLLTQISHLSTQVLAQIFATAADARSHKLTPGELAQAKASGVKVRPTQITVPALNVERIGSDTSELLNALCELSWALYHEPISVVMGSHAEELKSQYPVGYFAPPAPKTGQKKGFSAKKPQKAVV